MTGLERGQLAVMRIHAAIAGVIALAIAIAAELVLRSATDLPSGLVAIPIALSLVYPVLIAPVRHFGAWRYGLGADELRLRRGVLTEVETHVPLARVQHVDISQGPIERAFGVCRLLLHTAGTANSLVVLPGLSRATAEAIRDEIRARIRTEEG